MQGVFEAKCIATALSFPILSQHTPLTLHFSYTTHSSALNTYVATYARIVKLHDESHRYHLHMYVAQKFDDEKLVPIMLVIIRKCVPKG